MNAPTEPMFEGFVTINGKHYPYGLSVEWTRYWMSMTLCKKCMKKHSKTEACR